MQGSNNNNNQSGWSNDNLYYNPENGYTGWNNANGYPQSDYTGWNNAENYQQNDYMNTGWNNAENYPPSNTTNSASVNSYNQHDYKSAPTSRADLEKLCSGNFNDYNRAGMKNKATPAQFYVNNSYASSGYTIPTSDIGCNYSPAFSNPNAVFINTSPEKEKILLLLPFVIIIIGTAITALINDYNVAKNMMIVMAIPVVSVIVFLILSLTLIPHIKSKLKKKLCNHKITGKVVDIRFNRVNHTNKNCRRFTAIYKYSYKGKDYYLNGYTSEYEYIKVGTEFDVYINPRNPKQHYNFMRESGMDQVNAISIAFIIVVLSVVACVAASSGFM